MNTRSSSKISGSKKNSPSSEKSLPLHSGSPAGKKSTPKKHFVDLRTNLDPSSIPFTKKIENFESKSQKLAQSPLRKQVQQAAAEQEEFLQNKKVLLSEGVMHDSPTKKQPLEADLLDISDEKPKDLQTTAAQTIQPQHYHLMQNIKPATQDPEVEKLRGEVEKLTLMMSQIELKRNEAELERLQAEEQNRQLKEEVNRLKEVADDSAQKSKISTQEVHPEKEKKTLPSSFEEELLKSILKTIKQRDEEQKAQSRISEDQKAQSRISGP